MAGVDFVVVLLWGGTPSGAVTEQTSSPAQGTRTRRAKGHAKAPAASPAPGNIASGRLQADLTQKILEAAGTGIWMVDQAGRTLFANRAMAALLDCTVEELLGRPLLEFVAPEEHLLTLERMSERKQGKSEHHDTCLVSRLGRRVWVSLDCHPVHDSQGGMVGTVATATDITQRIQAKERLAQARREVEALNAELTNRLQAGDALLARQAFAMDATMEGMAILENGRYVYMNPPHARMYGFESSELHGRSWEHLYGPEERARIQAEIFPVLQAQGYWSGEVRGTKKDGSLFDVELNLTIAPSGDLVCCCRDITERKGRERALQQTSDEMGRLNCRLQEAARLKDEFLASMSHELRTPLTAVLGISEALQLGTYGPVNELQTQSLKAVYECGRHLLTLINDILDLSKIEAGQMEIFPAHVPVEPICREAIDLVRETAPQKHQYCFSVQPLGVLVHADPTRLKQMLVNLLGNAAKFTPAGGSIGLEVTADPGEGLLRMTVWDEGIGIDPKEVPRLFEPFVQLDSGLARAHSGTGLGLPLVQRMAEAHGGSICVESRPGRGSRFTIVLPWQAEPAGGCPQKAAPPQGQLALVSIAGSEERNTVTEVLRSLGFDIHFAEPGGALLRCAQALNPSLIILDTGDAPPGRQAIRALGTLLRSPCPQLRSILLRSPSETLPAPLVRINSNLLKRVSNYATLRSLAADIAGIGPSRSCVPPPCTALAAPPPGTCPPRGRVLLVDDNPTNLSFISAHLASVGYRVHTLTNGPDAIAHCRSTPPDAVLMDIQMPRMDGLEAIRIIRSLADPAAADVPIIALTALAMPGDRDRCIAAGANDYMSKPISLQALTKTLESLLAQRRATAGRHAAP